MNVINLTPHVVVVETENGRHEFPPSGVVARVSTTQDQIGEINKVPVVKTVFGDVAGIPEEKEGTVYIVSSLVAQAVAGTRSDVVAPDTGPTAIRDEAGRIVAVRRFQQW